MYTNTLKYVLNLVVLWRDFVSLFKDLGSHKKDTLSIS